MLVEEIIEKNWINDREKRRNKESENESADLRITTAKISSHFRRRLISPISCFPIRPTGIFFYEFLVLFNKDWNFITNSCFLICFGDSFRGFIVMVIMILHFFY